MPINQKYKEKRDKLTYKDQCSFCGKFTTIAKDIYNDNGRFPICAKCDNKSIEWIKKICLMCDKDFFTKEKSIKCCTKCKSKAKKYF